MLIKGFGINADASRLDGDLDLLRRDLQYFQETGFDYVEIPVHGIEAIRNGHLVVQRVNDACALLKEFPFRYTVKSPNPINLMNLQDLNMHKRMLLSSIQFTYAIGSNLLVYRCGRYISEEEFLLNGRLSSITLEMMEGLRLVEVEAIQGIADYARDLGIEICLENARPYLDGSPYSYGEFLDQLSDQVQSIDRSNVGISLDLGHAYLAANFYKFDFLEAVRLAKPFVKHMHVNDNFGKPSAAYDAKQTELVAAGSGDSHLPIGWGQIPIMDVLTILQGYEGVFIQELSPRYYRYCKQALTEVRNMVARAGWEISVEEQLAMA